MKCNDRIFVCRILKTQAATALLLLLHLYCLSLSFFTVSLSFWSFQLFHSPFCELTNIFLHCQSFFWTHSLVTSADKNIPFIAEFGLNWTAVDWLSSSQHVAKLQNIQNMLQNIPIISCTMLLFTNVHIFYAILLQLHDVTSTHCIIHFPELQLLNIPAWKFIVHLANSATNYKYKYKFKYKYK